MSETRFTHLCSPTGTKLEPVLADHKAFQRVLDAYGGLGLWRNLQHVIVQLDSLGGPLPLVKGLGKTFPAPRVLLVDPVRRRVEFNDYPNPGERAIFDAGTLRMIDRHGVVVFEQTRYRETFAGLKKYRKWSAADAAYFFGYALATYLGVPFMLPEYATSIQERKGGLRITARFPGDFDTHCQKQAFWFDSDGLLVRHDYRADIAGWWAAGSHFTSDYETVHGLPVARTRDVYVRCIRAVTPIPVLSARLRPIEVKAG